MDSPLKTIASIAFGLALIACLGIVFAACQPSEQTMRGAIGEFCHDTEDCRTGLSCNDNLCTCANPAACDACENVCLKMGECEVQPGSCTGACQNTIEQWSDSAIDTFEQCFMDRSCSQLQEDDEPAQTCYDTLPPIPEARADRCENFKDAARNCGAGQGEINEFDNECPIMARTRSDEVWARTDACAERIFEGHCPDIFGCLNDVFDLSPGFSGASSGNGTPPPAETNDPIDEMNDEFNGMNFDAGG